MRRPRLGLRARAAAAFGAMGLGVAVSMGVFVWAFTSSYLIEQREDSAMRQTYADARLTRSALRASTVDVAGLLTGLGGGGSSIPILRVGEEWYSGSLAIGRDAIPPELHQVVAEGGAGIQRFEGPENDLLLAVGVALPAVDAAYFEVFPLGELQQSLDFLRIALVVGALATSAGAAIAGRAVAGRVLRPLTPIAATAARVAAGDLTARLDDESDPDLEELTTAFNSMTEALEERIALDARFASDVSHELRSPLAVLRASTEIIERRRDQLPDVVVTAVDMLVDRLATFETLVLDLLEISRFDNRVATLDLEPISVETFLQQVVDAHAPGATLTIDATVPESVVADRRRLAQSLSNICVNAATYAGGCTAITASVTTDGALCVDVDDSGPGVPHSERRTVLERFARGSAGQRAGAATGSGLGLALVAEHMRLHGGALEVLDAPGGGARFRLIVPRRES